MKVLMYGWEFPPYISGGLGVACYNITKHLDPLIKKTYFVLPRKCTDSSAFKHTNIISAQKENQIEFMRQTTKRSDQHTPHKSLEIIPIESNITPYETHPKEANTRVHSVIESITSTFTTTEKTKKTHPSVSITITRYL